MRSQNIKQDQLHKIFNKDLILIMRRPYYPVVGAITLRFLIGLTVYENLNMHRLY